MSDVKNQLLDYQKQLVVVDEALKHAKGEQETELLDLKYKIQEVILLLQSDQGKTSDESAHSSSNHTSIDDEFAQFQMEIKVLEGRSNGDEPANKNGDTSDSEEEDEEESEANKELSEIIASLEGSRCKASFCQAWGEMGYYNAVVVSADFDTDVMKSAEDIEVKVMFCNPVCEKMKPCSFFLNGHCKFSEEKCRFSHGHRVSFLELQEFVLPDFSCLTVDSKCLAKCTDGLWRKATVEKCLGDQMFLVKFETSGKTDNLAAESILPLVDSDQETFDDDFLSPPGTELDESDDYQNICTTGGSASSFLVCTEPSFATWEKHTKGIGSKLMEKMGHVWGQGLGKYSDGRIDPVEAVILPAGKSLDKCIEMRDQCNPKGPVTVETRLNLEQDKEERSLKKFGAIGNRHKRKTVFDFINSKIAKVKGDGKSLDVSQEYLSTDRATKVADKNLNVEIFSVGEDIRRVKKEICKLHQSLHRNSDRNEVIRTQVQKKIAVQNDLLRSLQAKELKMNQDLNSQTSQKKLSIF